MKPNAPFTSITDKILFDKRVTPFELKVYMLVCQAAYGKQITSFPSQQRLSLIIGCSRQHVNRAIQRLVEFGYIEKRRYRKKRNNIYVIPLFDSKIVRGFIKSIENELKSKNDVTPNRQDDVIYMIQHDVTSTSNDYDDDVTSGYHRDVTPMYQESIQYESTQFCESGAVTEGSFQKTKTSNDSKNESLHIITSLDAVKEERITGGSPTVSFDTKDFERLFSKQRSDSERVTRPRV